MTGTLAGVIETRTDSHGVRFLSSPLLERAGVPHAFSTRVGGVSPPPFDSLNLGNPTGVEIQDDSDRIAENYRRLHRAIGCEDRRRCYVHQVHGCAVAPADDETFVNQQKADALISRDAATLLAVRTADCVPVLLATADGAAVAAIHAGWRGIVLGIVPRTIESIGDGNLLAAIGPHISPDAFEVGGEVLAEFTKLFGDAAPIRRTTNGKGHVDLRQAIRIQLESAGVSRQRIDDTDLCTHRDAGLFFSHRRERGVTGRMASVIGPRR